MLLDKKLKGKVAIPKFGWMGEMWMNAANLTLGGSYENFDPVVAFCRKIVRENGGLVMESNDQGMKLFQTGEIVAAPFWTGRAVMPRALCKAPRMHWAPSAPRHGIW